MYQGRGLFSHLVADMPPGGDIAHIATLRCREILGERLAALGGEHALGCLAAVANKGVQISWSRVGNPARGPLQIEREEIVWIKQ